MDIDKLKALLDAVARGDCAVDEALAQLKKLPFEDIGVARVDLHRALRQGLPEIIYCPGKTAGQIVEIAGRLRSHHKVVLGSRLNKETAAMVLPQIEGAHYDELGSMLIVGQLPQPDETIPPVAIVTAGTSDLKIAQEAAITLTSQAVPVLHFNDCGVAGLQRILSCLDDLQKATVVIVIAGMDGALPSVVAGLLPQPVIAVPTSVGYGASFEGLAALLSMLNSCAPGLTVVNIDNGLGAAAAALKVMNAIKKSQPMSVDS